MGTNKPPANSTKRQKVSALDRSRARWAKDQQAQQLLGYYGLSVDGPMAAPLFGIQHFTLSVYDDNREQAPQLVAPSLDYLSQDLGFAENAGYEAIKNLKIDEVWRKRLLDDTLERGKQELKRYLRHLRPLLMERGIYLYCTAPSKLVSTEVKTGEYTSKKGQRPLCALPTSVDEASMRGLSQERIEELAPLVAWLIPMLVLYRRLKLTEELQASFDGWLVCLNGQQKEQMHTSIIRYVPSLITDQITALLLPKWLKRE
jgi:hypothetical protein